jgi:hypothetical protein
LIQWITWSSCPWTNWNVVCQKFNCCCTSSEWHWKSVSCPSFWTYCPTSVCQHFAIFYRLFAWWGSSI